MSEFGYYSDNITRKIFENYALVPGTSHIYEFDLAYGELKSLTKEELIKHGAYFSLVEGEETYHFKICVRSPLQVDKSTTMRRQTFFQANQYKTAYATHGLFPYRGKFHPQLIKAIMNIVGIKEGDTVLDSMTGSGTLNIEASLNNVNSIGIDMSPFCILMTRAKIAALDIDVDKLFKLCEQPTEIFYMFEKDKTAIKLEDFDSTYSSKIKNEIKTTEQFNRLLMLVYLDATGYAKRRKNKTAEELFPNVLERYVSTITNFSYIKNELKLKLGEAKIFQGDARKLDINDESIDGIITSPPYSFAVDYIENDRPQLEYLGVSPEQIKKDMIGLYGKNREEQVKNYFNDMEKVIGELSRVLKPGKCCVVIIGSNEKQTGGIRHEEEIKRAAKKFNLNLFKEMARPITGIRNTMRNEYVLFFEKR